VDWRALPGKGSKLSAESFVDFDKVGYLWSIMWS